MGTCQSIAEVKRGWRESQAVQPFHPLGRDWPRGFQPRFMYHNDTEIFLNNRDVIAIIDVPLGCSVI